MLRFHEQFVIDPQGHPTAVVLPIREYQKLRQRLEDLEDVHYLKAHRHEKTIPFEQVVAERTAKGLLV